jgi:biotin carboxylase
MAFARLAAGAACRAAAHGLATSPAPLLDRLLVANRGEIALRVLATARRLGAAMGGGCGAPRAPPEMTSGPHSRSRIGSGVSGGSAAASARGRAPDTLNPQNPLPPPFASPGIPTVAVFSDADASAPHVAAADAAVRLGPAAPGESYLRGDAVLAAAKVTGATAVHPGYGFLSESAPFAEACAAAGVAFVGPPPAAIRAMGDKAASKRIMLAAGVPCVPGYHGEDQSDQR